MCHQILLAVQEVGAPVLEEETGSERVFTVPHTALVISTTDFLNFLVGQAWPWVMPNDQQNCHQSPLPFRLGWGNL